METVRLRTYLADHPIAYAGFRAIFTSDKGRHQTTAEKNEIPYVLSKFFIPLLIGYIVSLRARDALKSMIGVSRPPPSRTARHIFVMTSDHQYRTYGFEEVGARLESEGENVMFMCSPDAADRIDRMRQEGFHAESYIDLLRFVSLSDVLRGVPHSASIMYHLKEIVSEKYPDQSYTFVLNAIFLEWVKTLAFGVVPVDDPAIHTYSLMPYQVESTIPERLYVYQHGVQRTSEGERWSGTKFFPANVFLWGEGWIDNYRGILHEASSVHVVGSPWFDHLFELSKETTPEKTQDVLFIGGSQSTTTNEKEQRYERLVADVIRTCENNGWSLGIKLHPNEGRQWYQDRGWEEYVAEFDGIHEALIGAEVAVTHFSSAFVESIVVGTPVILDEFWSSGLSTVRPIEGATFIDADDLEEELKNCLNGTDISGSIAERGRLVDVGGSTARIVDIITERSEEN